MPTITAKRSEYDGYIFPNGWKMARERGLTPNNNPIGERWVLRNGKGEWVDCDQYRNDLAERHGLDLHGAGVVGPD